MATARGLTTYCRMNHFLRFFFSRSGLDGSGNERVCWVGAEVVAAGNRRVGRCSVGWIEVGEC